MKCPSRMIPWVLAVAATLAATFAFAELDGTVWKVRRSVGPSSAGGPVAFAVPADLYKNARGDLADLRLVTDDGTEVPFDVWTDAPSERVTDVPAEKLRAPSGEAVRLVLLDLGKAPVAHDRIVLTTLTKQFRTPLQVEASRGDDLWDEVRQQAFVYSWLEGGRTVERLHLDYPTSHHRYVRVSMRDPEADVLAGIEATLQHVERHEGQFEKVYDGSARSRTDPETRETWVTVDLGGSGVPHSRIALASTTARFARWAVAEASDDEHNWRFLTADQIDRRALTAVASGPAEGDTTLEYPETASRFVRVRVRNGEEPPVEWSGVAVEALRREVRFSAEPNKAYWLYYGNPLASTKTFTPRAVAPADALSAVRAGTVGVGREEDSPGALAGTDTGEGLPPFVLFGGIGAVLFLLFLTFVVIAKKRAKRSYG